MQIINIDNEALALGRAAFAVYAGAAICGPDADAYEHGMFRSIGLQVIPGAILGCISMNLTSEDAIVNAVARVSRRRRWTVWSVLEALTGDDPHRHLWSCRDDRYAILSRALNDAQPRLLLAA